KKVQCIICHKMVDPNRHEIISCSYCGSMYHSTCVSSWLLKYNACPMCQNVFVFPHKTMPIEK
ncbi:MAG: RING finger domain-containing protein, partial [Promethearchaeota archaeon]